MSLFLKKSVLTKRVIMEFEITVIRKNRIRNNRRLVLSEYKYKNIPIFASVICV